MNNPVKNPVPDGSVAAGSVRWAGVGVTGAAGLVGSGFRTGGVSVLAVGTGATGLVCTG